MFNYMLLIPHLYGPSVIAPSRGVNLLREEEYQYVKKCTCWKQSASHRHLECLSIAVFGIGLQISAIFRWHSIFVKWWNMYSVTLLTAMHLIILFHLMPWKHFQQFHEIEQITNLLSINLLCHYFLLFFVLFELVCNLAKMGSKCSKCVCQYII